MTEEEIEEPEEEDTLNIKHWISKMIQVTVLLTILIFVVERWLNISILVDTLLAVLIVLSIGFTHEGLHYYQAVKLGYKPKWYRTRFMMGFEIEHKRRSSTWTQHKKMIAELPYKVLLPVSTIIFIIGIAFNVYGVWIAGLGSMLLHGVSWFHEGKDVE